MKKKMVIALLFIASSSFCFSQDDSSDDDWVNLVPDIVTESEFTGRVGIGTQAPLGKLHITDIDRYPGLVIFRDQSAVGTPSMPPYGNIIDVSAHVLGPPGGPPSVTLPMFHVGEEGNVGLGTSAPAAALDMYKQTFTTPTTFDNYLVSVASENYGHRFFGITNNGVAHIGNPYNDPSVQSTTRAQFEVWGQGNTGLDMNTNYLVSFRNWAGDGRVLRVKGAWPGGSAPILQVEANGNYDQNVRFRVLANGKVVVGSENMQLPNGYKLYVDEGLITERITVAVENTTDWADYVFEEDYQLMPIDTLQEFVAANKHLPGVPSANDITESGIDVAKMDATLLKKIEELTLYIVSLKETNDQLRSQIQNLEERMSSVENEN